MGWEYCFDYGGGRAPWLSGMAQATAAQGFAGAALLPGADTARLKAAARGAYRSIPGRLTMRLSEGPWVRLYGFNSDIVLNAQLQTALSIAQYARITGDAAAAAYAAALRRSAAALLPRFDTGYWTYYQLPRTPSPLEYQTFVVDLLHRLSSTDPRFADAYQRFASYLKQPPAFRLADPVARARPLLALQARRRDRALERGGDAEPPAHGRLVRRRLEAALPRRRVSGAHRRPRLGREPRRGRRAADHPGRVAQRTGSARPGEPVARATGVRGRRRAHGSRPGQARPRARLQHGAALAGLAHGRYGARSRPPLPR